MKWAYLVLFSLAFVPLATAHADPWCDFLSIFGMCYDEKVEVVTEKLYFTTESIDTKDQPKLKQMELSNIEDGSRIESVGIAVVTPYNGQCQLYLEDKVLKAMPISEFFPCGTSDVPVNKIGTDAIQNNMGHNDKIKFIVKSNGMIVDSDVSIREAIIVPPAYYAKVQNGIVTNVIVADSEFIAQQNGQWIETSDMIRGNFAGVGYKYDSTNDVFIAPKIFDSWALNTNTWEYDPPVTKPDDGLKYNWNEKNLRWDLVK